MRDAKNKIMLMLTCVALVVASVLGTNLPEWTSTDTQTNIVTHVTNENFWNEKGQARDIDTNMKPGETVMAGLDALGRCGRVKALITKEMYEKAKDAPREDMSNIRPSGWTKNREVEYVFANGTTYHGWFWNRSHLLAHSLGGKEVKENLVTGTRAQNVGDNKGDGGMAHCEEMARDWLENNDGNLYYQATPIYEGKELVCRRVDVDMKSDDGSLDAHTEVYNEAPGFTIDYLTGAYEQVK